MTSSGLGNDLRALLGSDAVHTGDNKSYENGYRYGGGCAALVLRPDSSTQVSKIMRYCYTHQVSVLAQGAHTGLVGAATPDQSGKQLVLSLDRMSGVDSVEPLNRIAVCKAGTLLSELNRNIEPLGLFFPIDLGADPSIGGMVATNTGGAKLLRYGDVRRNLLGLEVVLADADGTIWSTPSGLRKDNTGFDLNQLFVGTGGAFGIVTAATLNLHRLPVQSATALLVPRGLEDAPEILNGLEARLGEMLIACEGISGNALEAALRHHPALRNPFSDVEIPDFCMLVEAATSVPAGSIDIETLLGEALWTIMEGEFPLLEDVRITTGPEFWNIRHSVSDGLKRDGRVLAFDIAVSRSDMPSLINRLTDFVAEYAPGARVCYFGHFGDGGVHFNLVMPEDATNDDLLREKIYATLVQEFDGSISAEHGIGPCNVDMYEKFVPAWRRDGQSRLQKLFDKRHILDCT